jgi:hypothetical protein
MIGPHTKVYGREKDRPVEQQGFDVLWVKQRPSGECMNCGLSLIVLGWNCEHDRKVTR